MLKECTSFSLSHIPSSDLSPTDMNMHVKFHSWFGASVSFGAIFCLV